MPEKCETERRLTCLANQKEISEIGVDIAMIKTMLESMKEQITSRFESVKKWQGGCEEDREKIREEITKLRITQAMQGVKIGAGSFVGAGIISGIIAYFFRK